MTISIWGNSQQFKIINENLTGIARHDKRKDYFKLIFASFLTHYGAVVKTASSLTRVQLSLQTMNIPVTFTFDNSNISIGHALVHQKERKGHIMQ